MFRGSTELPEAMEEIGMGGAPFSFFLFLKGCQKLNLRAVNSPGPFLPPPSRVHA